MDKPKKSKRDEKDIMSAPRQRLFQQLFTRSFYATPRVNNRKYDVYRGRGGTTEEEHMARAIRKIKGMKAKVLVEVMNACHVSIAAKLLPFNAQRVPIWIRVLTHADRLSDAALSYQMQQASRLHPHSGNNKNKNSSHLENDNDTAIPVVAMNLADPENINHKRLQNFLDVLLGARNKPYEGDLANNTTILVCGLPNAGKSSLIYILSRPRTLQIKKKGKYHLPRINATPGWTLGVKRHVVLESNLTLCDVPGLRPRAEALDLTDYAHLLVSGAMQAHPGVLDESEPLRRTIVDVLWKGLCRHAFVSGTALPMQWAHADAWLAAHQEKFFGESQQQKSPASVVHHLMEYCRNGEYGGMVLEEGHPTPLAPDEAAAAVNGARAAFQLNRATHVVAMNEAAMKLRDIGNGVDPRLVKMRKATCLSSRSRCQVGRSKGGSRGFVGTKYQGKTLSKHSKRTTSRAARVTTPRGGITRDAHNRAR